MSGYRLTDSVSDNQRMYAQFRCARIAELLAARVVPLSFVINMLEEVVGLHAAASAINTPEKIALN